jgi:nucleoside recognition membrane protein YjiH
MFLLRFLEIVFIVVLAVFVFTQLALPLLRAAEQTKKKDIALGEGESTRMRLVMQANGALEQKLKTYEKVSEMYAKALGDFKGSLVPSVMMGSTGTVAGNSAMSFIDLLTAKAAKDLSLDFSMNVPAPAK